MSKTKFILFGLLAISLHFVIEFIIYLGAYNYIFVPLMAMV